MSGRAAERTAGRGSEGSPDRSAPIPVLEGPEAERWLDARRRRPAAGPRPEVLEILEAVRTGGDEALLRLTGRLDGVRPTALEVPRERWRAALADLTPERREALERARRNLERFHAAQLREETPVEVEPGVRAWREFRPLERVGIYVPGGRAAYPSSLLMGTVPARLAGCGRVVACCPPGSDGLPPASVLAAAELADLDALYAVGGAQAVAAMTWGTESVPAVDRIVGPGGRWVNEAKLAVSGVVAIDLPAGPSEVVVWADGSADPRLVAAELLAQAEHGPDSLAVAVLPDAGAAARVQGELAAALERAERRELAAESLAGSALLVAGRDREAAAWVDDLAAEHLVLLREDAREAAARVRHAGAVFMGPWSPVAAGDYAAGTNHVLPTGRRARSDGGLSVDDFGRWIQFQELSREGLASLAPAILTLARWEGLPAHADAVRVRLADGRGGAASDDRAPAFPRSEGGERDGAAARGPAARKAASPSPADLVRPHLRELEPYRTARSEHLGGILLDANENPFGPPAGVSGGLNRYPDPRTPELRSALAAHLDVEPERLWIGNGSDEAIDLLVRALAAPGEPVGAAAPSYGVYAARARAHGARPVPVPLDEDFDLDVGAAARALAGARLAFLCSPNNPTGNRLSAERIEALLDRWGGVVAVDEAYVEFASGPSLASRAGAERPRLVVLRTFSKAWGLAGARVGWLVGHPELVDVLDRAGLPYPLSAPSASAARAALADVEGMRDRVRRIVAERERVRSGLERLGLPALPSEANFLAFRVDAPRRVQEALASRHGVVVRDRSSLPRLEGCLRASVGTPAENDRFLEGLDEALGEGRR
ncbi:MAG TPA: histidinol dehydrogenase [Gemmatimonadota bacterium]|nr:histidinol dehydrogenase [Gemmatimonadota bacterium]